MDSSKCEKITHFIYIWHNLTIKWVFTLKFFCIFNFLIFYFDSDNHGQICLGQNAVCDLSVQNLQPTIILPSPPPPWSKLSWAYVSAGNQGVLATQLCIRGGRGEHIVELTVLMQLSHVLCPGLSEISSPENLYESQCLQDQKCP
jgi:hypothetical protein